ncbi:MAG: AAA family ATPase [Desulfobulbaceae bacterium]|nr:AAA family ATPase [Desulfobulbaceae bacterium]
MIDISILRVMATREGFDKMYSAIPLDALEPKTKTLVSDIKRYYDAYTTDESIDFVKFRDSFQRWHPQLDEAGLEYYDKILNHVEINVDDVSRSVLINSMLELRLATDAQRLLHMYNEGEEVSIIHDLLNLAELAVSATQRKTSDNWIKPDMDSLIESMDIKHGLTWRLDYLNERLRPLVPGDMVLVAGRPDTGKTTFISDNVTHMSPQVDTRPILWLNNEGPGTRIVSRLIQSALAIDTDQMKEMHSTGILKQAYADAIGEMDRIRVIDIHDYWNWQVEELIEAHKPKLVVADMIDNIKFSGMNMHDGARTDQILESMYQWYRRMAVKHNFVAMSTSQISADGQGQKWPTMDMLKDSKTGKQGALDMQIMIGMSDKPAEEYYRYIGTPKNKLGKPGKGSYVRHEVRFDNSQARYIELGACLDESTNIPPGPQAEVQPEPPQEPAVEVLPERVQRTTTGPATVDLSPADAAALNML